MHLFIAGTRGTTAITASDRAVFGGDTTCLLVTGSTGSQVVLDCGSGLPSVAPLVGDAPDLLVLLTHFHLDHLVGLPSFAPMYDPRARLLVAASRTDGSTGREALQGLIGPPYWPIPLDRLPARLSFADLPPSSGDQPLRAGGLEVRWTPLPHPGGCTAFRIDEPATRGSLVLATDAEWEDAPKHMLAGFLDLCRKPAPCALLICDGQYERDAIASRRGWGHTSWERAVDLAKQTGAERLLLTHHDPQDDDTKLAARDRALQAVLPTAALARQGQRIELVKGESS
jgi:phosphoribosyl 1,2-cyclic phosphodiesterase